LTVGSQLVVHLGLEGDAESFDANGLALVVELHFRDADTRVSCFADDSREEVELAVGTRAAAGLRMPPTS
jgi:hypothetical protein